MPKPNRANVLAHMFGNENTFHILRAISAHAGKPPVAPHELLDELDESGVSVPPSLLNRHIGELLTDGLMAPSKDKNRIGGSFTVPKSPVLEKFDELAEAIDAEFPPRPEA